MKRILTLLTALTILLLTAACGGGSEFPLAVPDLDYSVNVYTAESVNGIFTITGTTEYGKELDVLVIPKAIAGSTVQSIAAGALDGCKVKSLIIPEDCGIAYLNNGCFSGAGSLKHIVILKKHSDITVSGNLLDGAASGAKVYVKPENYSDYVSYYTWGAFASRIAKYE